METLKNNFSLLTDISIKTLSKTKIWINNENNTRKKIFLCVGSIWILTDIVVSFIESANDSWDRNILGPFTYLSLTKRRRHENHINNQLKNNNNYVPVELNAHNRKLIFGLSSNIQFSSPKGLASNMIGGYIIGFFLGISTLSITKSVISQTLISPWSLYIFNSSIFYTMEYLWAALFHPNKVSIDSFMLYSHSSAFHIALFLSAIEYWCEYILFYNIKILHKYSSKIRLFGLSLIIIGQIIRTVSEFTAGINFTHLIAVHKTSTHKLITHGIYSIFRHPSYFGFFYWSIGTQLLLSNPISTIIYTLASWKFFAERIPYEEQQLIKFFGEEYEQYRKKTIIGIPFIG